MPFLLEGDNIKNEEYMFIALKEAKKADRNEEIPVGALIIKNNRIISKAYNKKEKNQDSTKHAEIIAIQKANKKEKSWRLNECLLFVTLEPCVMCLGAIIESRIKKVVCGTKNDRYHDTIVEILKKNDINIEFGVLEKECKKIIKDFFLKKRKK